MALESKQSVCIKCGDIHLTDTTGVYNNPDNLTGYGTPNEDFGDLTPYTAAFTSPKATTPVYTLDLYASPPTPDADDHYEYVITQEQLGYLDQPDIPSGVWEVLITIGFEEKLQRVFATGDIQRRITKCICCSGLSNLWLDYDLKGAIALFKCHKYEQAQKMMDQLYRDTAACCDCQ